MRPSQTKLCQNSIQRLAPRHRIAAHTQQHKLTLIFALATVIIQESASSIFGFSIKKDGTQRRPHEAPKHN
jgi:hypothetical protein